MRQEESETFMRLLGKLIVVACLAAGGGLVYVTSRGVAEKKQVEASAVPVTVATAKSRDFPIYKTTIATVQAYNMVTIRARVDGTLQQVLFKEGQDVKAGDLLAIIDPRPLQAALDQAIATKAKDEAQLANAKRDLQRFIDLRQFETRQRVDTQRALVDQLQATIEGDKAAIENATVQLSYTKIVSPIDGRTGARLVDAGNMIHASEGTALLMVTQIEPIFVTFTLPQDVLDELFTAQKHGEVAVEAYSRNDSSKIATGVLSLIDNQIDTTTGTIRVKATFANSDRRLWPGEFVNVRVVTEVRKQAVVVPAQAVQRGPKGLYVYAVKPDQTVEIRPVQTGMTSAGATLVEKGLVAGEEVVIDGQYKLKAGIKIKPVTQTELTAITS
jgi:membrane fusion protein, multidrug efflux system